MWSYIYIYLTSTYDWLLYLNREEPYVAVVDGLNQPTAVSAPSKVGEGGDVGLGFDVRISAFNGIGYGLPSAFVWMKPMAIPSPPRIVKLNLVAGSSTSLRVSWYHPMNDTGAVITHFVVSWELVTSKVSNITEGFSGTCQSFLNVFPVSQSYKHTVANLTPGTLYQVYVEATNIVGGSTQPYATPSTETQRRKADFPFGSLDSYAVSLNVRSTGSLTNDQNHSNAVKIWLSTSTLVLSWTEPSNFVVEETGDTIRSYKIEWF
ncbi:unnamed protein product [Albugo candida]|uniref:Fibronectin type-III domain-containing protein n=1 Tax=Albugo candida TaxID=65357 RepID=A0A024FU22_9STRA|nr:unnamed protein product [Albugo candida]|eukprot:CCI10506.1 unnamed protein product [Albugo candida]